MRRHVGPEAAHAMGSVAVVTGAATGIGAAVTRALLARGWVVVASRMPRQRPEAGTEQACFVEVDLTGEDAPRLIAKRAQQEGGAQLFVGSAGISLPGPIELRADVLATEFAVNAAAPARIIAALLPQLRKGPGRIVLVGAGQGRVGLPFGGGYAASKAALAAIADALRAEVHHDAITVSLIEPGAVRTGILDSSRLQAETLLARTSADHRRRYEVPLTRTLDKAARAFDTALPPERIADLVMRITGSRAPRPRYVVGRAARLLAVLSYLPPRWRTRLVQRIGDASLRTSSPTQRRHGAGRAPATPPLRA